MRLVVLVNRKHTEEGLPAVSISFGEGEEYVSKVFSNRDLERLVEAIAAAQVKVGDILEMKRETGRRQDPLE